MDKKQPINADDIPPNAKLSNYPEPFRSMMARREKRRLGDFFGLSQFGVNKTRIFPGGISALLHRHAIEEEFIYILDGTGILKTETQETPISAGMCMGFPANGAAHQIINNGDTDLVYLEIGYRSNNDNVTYPNDDLIAQKDDDGKWGFTHKDGKPY